MLKRIYKVGSDELFNIPLLVPHSIRFVANNLIILAKFVMELGFFIVALPQISDICEQVCEGRPVR